VLRALHVGVYGDVSRVKIMFNKKDSALVQFADPAQAQIGQPHLLTEFLHFLRHASMSTSVPFVSVFFLRVSKTKTFIHFVEFLMERCLPFWVSTKLVGSASCVERYSDVS